MTVIRLNIVSRVRLVHGRGFCGTERDGGTRLVHGRGFCGTERDGGHGWYTGRDSEVRNGVRARLVHGRGFCGTERDGGHGWYTTMGTGERNVRKEGFIHKMKPHRSQHAADETGVRRKRRRKKRWKGRRRKGRKGLRDQYCRGPKMEVPMRTMVAPWRMARGQSWDIPMESSVKSVSWG